MPLFRKKSEIIEAVQFTGNDEEIMNFCPYATDPKDTKPNLIILTRKGDRMVFLYDWVIKGIEGDCYPCPSSVFEATYEAI